MNVTQSQEVEVGQIAEWRRARLADAGFSLQLAVRIAADDRYDLRALIELTERGCAPELAVRILAPLEKGAAAA